MKEIIREQLRRLTCRRFFRPDGVAAAPRHLPLQPYDRLLFVSAGVKREPMSLDGRNTVAELRPGDCWLIGRSVWEYGSWETPHELFCIVPRDSYLRLSFYRVGPGGVRENWFFHSGRPCPDALNRTMAALKELEPGQFAAATPLAAAAVELAAAETVLPVSPRGKALAAFDRVRNYVEYNFHRRITRRDAARRTGLSEAYVSELFREFAGRSFQDYLGECRMNMARQLLLDPAVGVKEAAWRSGFAGDVYFVRRFRERYGITPGRWRLNRIPAGETNADS